MTIGTAQDGTEAKRICEDGRSEPVGKFGVSEKDMEENSVRGFGEDESGDSVGDGPRIRGPPVGPSNDMPRRCKGGDPTADRKHTRCFQLSKIAE